MAFTLFVFPSGEYWITVHSQRLCSYVLLCHVVILKHRLNAAGVWTLFFCLTYHRSREHSSKPFALCEGREDIWLLAVMLTFSLILNSPGPHMVTGNGKDCACEC